MFEQVARSRRIIAAALVVALASPAAYAGQWTPEFSTPVSAPQWDSHRNWSLPPAEAEKALTSAPYRVLSVQSAGAGVTGAQKVDLLLEADADDEEEVHLWSLGDALQVKSKPFPRGKLDHWNNSPRKEIAAYQIQKLFLEPDQYVVPTTIAVAVSLEVNRRLRPGIKPTIEGTRSVLHAVSLWLQDVTLPDDLYDEERFRKDPDYAYRLASFNVLTYLADHKDNRRGNFLISKDDRHRQVYAIDNGIAFGSWFFNWFIPSSYRWRKIVVPAVPGETVARLRGLERGDLDFLSTVAEFQIRPDGLVEARPAGVRRKPKRGVVIRDDLVQIGLSRDEIDDVWERIEDLLDDVDDGKIPVF